MENMKFYTFYRESNNFDDAQGGIINIDTLYNGINGKRKNYELALAQHQH